jgi:uncharacterized pyridoxamine 5'-phosphate oxidase family protein
MIDPTLKAEVFDFLQQSKVGVIGTVNAKGEPELATVTIVVDADFNVYFVTRRDTRKFLNLERDKHVGMVIGASPTAPTTVQIQGDAEFIQNFPNDAAEFLSRAINLAQSEYEPLEKITGSNFVIIKVKPTWLRWMTFAGKNRSVLSQEGYRQIISDS